MVIGAGRSRRHQGRNNLALHGRNVVVKVSASCLKSSTDKSGCCSGQWPKGCLRRSMKQLRMPNDLAPTQSNGWFAYNLGNQENPAVNFSLF